MKSATQRIVEVRKIRERTAQTALDSARAVLEQKKIELAESEEKLRAAIQTLDEYCQRMTTDPEICGCYARFRSALLQSDFMRAALVGLEQSKKHAQMAVEEAERGVQKAEELRRAAYAARKKVESHNETMMKGERILEDAIEEAEVESIAQLAGQWAIKSRREAIDA